MTSLEIKPGDELEDLDIPPVIDTADTDFIWDFFNPVLTRSIEYKRGVGFFTSGWLRNASHGIAGLAENGGRAKWIISPKLSEEDWEAFQKGEEAKWNDEMYKLVQKNI